MKEPEILKVIASKLKELPESQRLLGEYILSNYKEVANLSALDLGAKVGVSDATVVRFAKSLGYSGYPEIKTELFKYLTREDDPSQKMIKALGRMKKVNMAVTEVFENDIKNIQETFKSFSLENMESAVSAINKAQKIYILGLNSCEALAGFLNFHLSRLCLNVKLITSSGLVMFEQLAFITEADLLIVISYPRYSRDSLDSIKLAKSVGAKVISITDKTFSPIAEASDIALIAHSSSPGFYNSYAAATTICNVLVLSMAMLDEKRSLKALKTIEDFKKDHDLYI
ncbi:MAG: MurR/RpiR family transcriptional regulator [Bacillota bacterium]